ncbi:MAG: hypothetical protein ACYDCN_10625 [Bacteroidia bacterium]
MWTGTKIFWTTPKHLWTGTKHLWSSPKTLWTGTKTFCGASKTFSTGAETFITLLFIARQTYRLNFALTTKKNYICKMKRFSKIVVVVIGITTLASCKKDYTCACVMTSNRGYVYTGVTTYYATKTSAEKQCAAQGSGCSLK